MTSRLCRASPQLAIVHGLTVPPGHRPSSGTPVNETTTPVACANCHTPLHGAYCHHCGQAAHNPLKSVAHAIEDVFESFWHLDGRIFRSLYELWIPGRIASNYLAGQRVRYLPPLRLFVVLSLFAFFAAQLAVDGQKGLLDIRPGNTAFAELDNVARCSASAMPCSRTS